jgi:DUF4097 and DUF4098 domain-containing protein YvlB
MSNWEFPGSEPIEIVIDVTAGSVAVAAEAAQATTVRVEGNGRNGERLLSELKVSFSQGRLEIIEPTSARSLLRGHAGLEVTVTAPAGSSCMVRTASADVSCLGRLGELDVRTASGDVTAASVAGRLQVRTASGDVWLERADGTVQVKTASGDVQLRQAEGDVTMQTASGDVAIGRAAASVQVQTASGDARVGSVSAGEVSMNTASGGIQVGVAPGAGVYLDLSSLTGTISSELDETDGGDGDVRLQVSSRSVTGGIRITRADQAAAV